MFSALAKLVSRGWWLVLLVWIVATVWLTHVAPPLDSVTTEGPGIVLPDGYSTRKTGLPRFWERIWRGSAERYSSREAEKIISRAFGQESSRLIVVFQRPVPLTAEDRKLIDDAVLDIQRLGEREDPRTKQKENIVSFTLSPSTHPYLTRRLTSTDNTTAICAVALRTQFVDVKTHAFIGNVNAYLDSFVKKHADRHYRYYTTDSAAIGYDYEVQADLSLRRTQWITVTLVVVILLLMYRSLLGPAVTMATVMLSLHVATCVMAIIGKHGMEVPKLVPVYLVVIIYGAVTDYCMFIIGRFREELARGHSRFEAVRIAVSQVGAATTASAATTIAGLAMMAFADFEIFRATGPILGVGLAVGLLASITFMPVLVVLFGRHLFWPARDITTVSIENTRSGRFWARLADVVVRRPGLLLVLVVGAFIPFATLGASVNPSYDIFGELPSDSRSVVGNRIIQEKFPENSRSEQIVLVLSVPDAEPNPAKPDARVRPKDFWRTYAGLRVIDDVTEAILKRTADVVEVRSITRWMGRREPPMEEYLNSNGGVLERIKVMASGLALAFPRYVATTEETEKDEVRGIEKEPGASVTRLYVVLRHDPFSEKALSIAKEIRWDVMPALQVGGVGDTRVFVGGVSGHMADLTKVTRKDFGRLRWMVLGVLYIILAIMLRGGIAPIYLLATMVLNYFATMGILQLIFVNLLGAEGLDWKVEFFLFVLLVAIGVDYNIYIMSRLTEELRRRPFRQALHHAIVFTGAIITSCGIIMAGTFGSMMGSTLTMMVQMGAAMAIGVLLDTFFVRPLVVPSLALLIEKVKERLRASRPV